jgi:large subunit ribosomal protein L32
MHLFLEAPTLSLCPKCQKEVLPHTVCQNCGYYKGEMVVDVMKKLTKKERKQKEKEMAAKEAEQGAAQKGAEPSWEGLSKKE